MRRKPLLLWLATVLLALFVYESVGVRLMALRSFLPSPHLLTLMLVGFSLLHAAYALGGRRALVFFAISGVVSWVFEQVGVATGAVYGPYHYTEMLGIKLGHVPLLIPLAWFMMIYPSYVIANLILTGRAVGSPRRIPALIGVSLLGAMAMTAWDLLIDPVMSSPPVNAWQWHVQGEYFGVPVQNFAGWVLTTFTVYLLYRFYEASASLPDLSRGAASLPLIAYGAMMASASASQAHPALAVIGPFAMGIPLLAAALKLLE